MGWPVLMAVMVDHGGAQKMDPHVDNEFTHWWFNPFFGRYPIDYTGIYG